MPVVVTRYNQKFSPDPSRVIARFLYMGDDRSLSVVKKVMEMTEDEVRLTLSQVLRGFSNRHRNISKIYEKHFNQITHLFDKLEIKPEDVDLPRKVLIGSYFTMEYSIESAAFFNPSMVIHPDQSELAPKELRVIISFRATGEGHISSMVFRAGVLDKDNNLSLEEAGQLLDEAEIIKRHIYDKESFMKKLDEMQSFDNIVPAALVLDELGDKFTYGELKKCVESARSNLQMSAAKELLLSEIMWLASSHYEIQFSLDTAISERVIFPISDTERHGIEDARWVRFTEDDGTAMYYGTYTAYDGSAILPKLITTKNFYHYTVLPLHGEIAQTKGMALFPRKIKGKYAMLCRIDGVNNYIAFSDQIGMWRTSQLLMRPKYHWELLQIGNSGSPIETEEGWLVLTHAVGPMREYVLSAALFDLDDPTREIGRLSEPLLMPNEAEREGYVPNVVYSCGSILHNGDLIIPYAMSDYASTYATVDMRELLDELKRPK